MVNKVKIIRETRGLYQQSEISTLKMMILLISFEKIIYTDKAIYIMTGIGPLLTSVYMYKNSGNAQIFIVAFIIHALIFPFIKKKADEDGLSEDYEEARIKCEELLAMLKEKKAEQ